MRLLINSGVPRKSFQMQGITPPADKSNYPRVFGR
jgi:hypothetical protein